MNTILQNLKAGFDMDFGTFKIHAFTNGDGMSVRMEGSGLTGPTVSVTKAGFKQLLDWVDAETEAKGNRS